MGASLREFRDAVRRQIEADLETEQRTAEALRAEVIPQLEAAIASARAARTAGRAWLFGSFAWGEPRAESDIDVLVEWCADPDALAADIGRATGRAAHVVELAHAPATLRARVLAEGKPL